ncbi:MAG: hypothetical protein IT373_38035 [Polyangiaceae bacterium]|nr:hypothetical protein [Polyangiaceae bacterium]
MPARSQVPSASTPAPPAYPQPPAPPAYPPPAASPPAYPPYPAATAPSAPSSAPAWANPSPTQPTQGYPTHDYPSQGYPAQGYPAQGYPAQGYYPAQPYPTQAYGPGASSGWPGAQGYGMPDAEPEPEEPEPPFVDLALGTHAPLSLDAEATVELPARILLQGGFGWMPPGYRALVTKLVSSASGGDDALATLVDGSLDTTLVLRISAGWRPVPTEGFEIWLGYTAAFLSGSVTPTDLGATVEDPLGAELASELASDVKLQSTLHNIHVGLGWRFVVWDHLVVRASVGYTQTLGATSGVSIPDEALEAEAAPIVEKSLNDAYKGFVKLPVVGLTAGYRF